MGCCDARFGVGQLGLVHDVKVGEDGAVSVKVLPCCIFGMTRLVTSVKESLSELERWAPETFPAWKWTWHGTRLGKPARHRNPASRH